MASIVGKRQGNKTYYYLVESARVGGKPRIVSQRYLGPAEEIVARLAETGPGEPDRTRHLAFGDIAAVWSVLERLKVAEIIDEVVGPRRADAGASVGTYISLAALNRACDPCSKLAFSDWWAKTAADRWVHLAAGALDHRRFWEAMDLLGEDQLAEAERRIVAHMVEAFGVELSGLVLDMTNFATWIASANDRAPIAQRGHSKQKRSDLRLVGLGLVVSTDGGIPLVSHAYPGNRPDVTQFPAMVGELARRFGAIPADVGKLTLVFDAGQNSDDNYELLDGLPFHFVGSLPPSDHPELLAVPKATYQPVEGFSGLSAFEAEKAVFGKARRIVVTHSEVLHEKQSAGFDQTLAKARGQLSAVQARLARGKTRKEKQNVEAEVANILKPRWLSRVLSATLTGEEPPELRLRYRTSQAAGPAWKRSCSASGPCSATRHRAGPDGGHRGRVPLPGVGRGRLPSDEGPQRGLLFAHVPLDRPEDPRPCLLLRAGPDGRPPHGERSRAGRHAHERARTARHAGRHRRDGTALPRRAGPAPSPAGDHRDGRHATAPLPAFRPGRLRRGEAMTAAKLPDIWAVLEGALRERRPVHVAYHGRRRLLCPHALGWKEGRPMLLGYQTGGQTSSGALPADPRQRWRCLFVDEMDHVLVDMTAAWGTANNYNPAHPFPAVDEVAVAVPASNRPLR